MSAIAETDRLFFDLTGMDRGRVERLVSDTLGNADDGELFLEFTQSEAVVYEDGRVKSASFDTGQGFGLRAVAGETTGYAHASEVSEAAIRRAADTVRAVQAGHSGVMAEAPSRTNRLLYGAENPIAGMGFEAKVALLAEIDAYARGLDTRVQQVTASVAGSWQAVQILRAGGARYADIRPLVRLSVSIVVGDGTKQETGSAGAGGRLAFERFVDPTAWRGQVDEALRQALVNLDARPAPAGEMTVVLGPGWPGVMLHEAVGHGLEGDFNRKKTSLYSGMMGDMVAAKGVTVVDDGTMPDRRGSLSIDDEGTPTTSTTLIEDGRLVGYMQDRLNARLMGMAPTGNGRRQSHAHMPMPRMTNTYMMGGDKDPKEILASVKNGLYAVNFGGGQVDIVSGNYVFSCTEGYMIEDGRIGAPVQGATLNGNGPESMRKVSMIGNDLALDPGIGTCGKDGQGVPVGVGQPTIRIDGITVGGTAA